jgi:acetylornithine/N-succinyldiaminopimelate aminotransferase
MTVAAAPALLPVYARQDVTFVRGEGSWLFDDRGARYLDLVAGIAVVSLGHCHPAPLAAAQAQLEQLWHVSNLYWSLPMQDLASRLSDRFGGARAFFCNSGAEAIEAALKYARRATGRPGIVALENSFHGRTLGALSATGQPAKSGPFAPLLPGVRFACLNDLASLRDAVSAQTACILIEPIQGEGGIHAADAEFLAGARELADEAGALLVFDEVQTGVGRTGSFFAFEQAGVRPDAVALAKGLANGLPIGCLLVADRAPEGFRPGDHASTFGGNPVVCAAGSAVCDELTDDLLRSVVAKEQLVRATFEDARGRGLLLALDVDRPASEVVGACLEQHILIGTAGEHTLRLTPPLTISEIELIQGLEVLQEVLG